MQFQLINEPNKKGYFFLLYTEHMFVYNKNMRGVIL